MKNDGYKWIYQLPEPPEQMDNPNDYFICYAQTGDSGLFNAFLHYHEPIINEKIIQFIKQYGIPEYYLVDLKQIYAHTVWEAMQEYDPDDPIVLLQKIRYPVLGRWHDFVRTMCGTVTVPNRGAYQNLRNVARLYFEKCTTMPERELISQIAQKVNLSEATVLELVQTALEFKYPLSLDAESPKSDEISAEDSVPRALWGHLPASMDAEEAYLQLDLRRRLRKAIRKLSPKDMALLEMDTGICLNCFQDTEERKTYNEIALILGYAGESSVEKRKDLVKKNLQKEMNMQKK